MEWTPSAFCILATASDSDAGEPLRGKESIVAVEAILGEVTRDNGDDDALSRAVVEDEELGLELPFRLLIDAEASDAVLRFFVAAALRAAILLLGALSGINGTPADRN